MDFLPNNMQGEYAILGAVLIRNEVMTRIGYLLPEHFYSTIHAAIFEAMLEKHRSGEPITPFNLALGHDAKEAMNETGGLQRYLTGAISSATVIYNIEADARELVGLAQKRAFIAACREAADAAVCESDRSPADVHAANLYHGLDKVLRTGGVPDFQDDYEVIEQIMRDISSTQKPYSTGLSKLDTAMGGGLFPFRSYGFAARKKVGKTVLASTISHNLNQQGIKHLFICGEMSPKEIHQRTLSRITDTFPSAFYSDYGKSQDFMNRLAQAAKQTKRCTLYHNAPGLTFSELKRAVALAVYRHKITGFILDYWQLVGGKEPGRSTSEHLDEVAQWIADFCRKNGLWSITMAQINQEGNTRGGEGIRLAFDQVYALRGMGEKEDISEPQRWLDMMDTRYTQWMSIGDQNEPGLLMNPKGPFFEHPNNSLAASVKF